MAYSRRLGLFAIAACSLFLNTACVRLVPAPTPTVPVPVAQPWSLQVTVRGIYGDPLPDATGVLQFDLPEGSHAVLDSENVNGRLVFAVPAEESDTWGGRLIINAPGYQQGSARLVQPDEDQPDFVLQLSLPPTPSRAEVTAVKLTFQGLTACTVQFGCIPWFEPFIVALTNPADRLAVYAAKRAQGDTHLILECFSSSRPVYNEAPFTGIIAPNCDADPQTFLSLVEEVIQNGFTPVVTYDGDNGDGEPFGSPNAKRQAPVLQHLLAGSSYGDFNPYVLYFRGWDSVFYGSSPANIQAFGVLFRQILPNGYLAIEFNTGHIPLGNGPSDYAPGGAMTDYDVIMGEFDNWPATGDGVWQVLGRLLGPSYHRPADQPPSDDVRPPWYLSTGSPRGPYVVSCFEWAEYAWTHGQLTYAQYQTGYAYYKSLGCPNF